MPASLRLTLLAALVVAAAAFQDGSAHLYAQRASADGNSTMTKVSLTDAAAKTGAVCLDGSPAAYYIRPGSGSGASKWYIHHQGGGWCESLDDCLSRSKGQLGSSKSYPPTFSQDSGYFSVDPTVNPQMYNWNSVFMRYCDGGSFSGNNETVTTYKGAKLTFRGKRIREAMVESLSAAGLAKATDLVVSGCSAGGLATFLHTDQWCDALAKVNPHAKCVGMPDSGFFLDYQSPKVPSDEDNLGTTVPGNYHNGLKWVFDFMNTTAGVNQACIDAYPQDQHYRCQFAEHSAKYLHTPMFPLQSEYDAWQTGHVLAPGDDVNTMGKNITLRMSVDLLKPHPESGVFLDSCHHHCGSWGSIRIDGDLVANAFQKWYDGIGTKGSKKVWVQGKPYPCDQCCKPNDVE